MSGVKYLRFIELPLYVEEGRWSLIPVFEKAGSSMVPVVSHCTTADTAYRTDTSVELSWELGGSYFLMDNTFCNWTFFYWYCIQ